MTTLSPSGVANALHITADLIHQHGPATTRRVRELALAASGNSDGRSSQGDHSDPTYRQATTHDPLAQIDTTWRDLNDRLWGYWAPTVPHSHMTRLGGYGGPWAVQACRLIAARLRTGTPANDHATPPTLGQLLDVAYRLQDVIYEAAPIDREQAEEELRQSDYLVMRAKDCDACESPTPELRSGYCDACRKRIPKWEQLHPGDTFDRAQFKQMILTDMATGLISRPASPHAPVLKRLAHEDDAA